MYFNPSIYPKHGTQSILRDFWKAVMKADPYLKVGNYEVCANFKQSKGEGLLRAGKGNGASRLNGRLGGDCF